LNVCKVFDDVTSDGKLFHVFAAATGKARSPIVRSRVGGTPVLRSKTNEVVVDRGFEQHSTEPDKNQHGKKEVMKNDTTKLRCRPDGRKNMHK